MTTTRPQVGPNCRFCGVKLLKDMTCNSGECEALEEVEDLTAQLSRYQHWIGSFAVHDLGCSRYKSPNSQDPTIPCSCGLSVLLQEKEYSDNTAPKEEKP